METRYALPDRVSPSLQVPALPNLLAYGVAAAFILYQIAVSYEIAILSPVELVWNGLVYITPTRLLLGAVKRSELRQNSSTWSQVHAAKSEAMRSLLGLGSGALLQQIPAAGSNIVRRLSLAPSKVQSDAPPGLGNWDNSCYQNSVLQGLSAVEALRPFLATIAAVDAEGADSTSAALQDTVGKLNDGNQNGRHFWTPAKLKSMSSWQQQDAQEYYSKIVDELEKEATKGLKSWKAQSGLEAVAQDSAAKSEQIIQTGPRNPLEGLLAQRVSCTRCNASDGLSMIPFNCLTVPLGAESQYDLTDCLSEYTALEEITDVECTKCTLLKAQAELQRRLPPSTPEPTSPAIKALLDLPPALRVAMAERLAAINEALESDDFSDKTLTKICQISKANRVSSTKTRQAVVGRPPKALVVHVQRSVFDEMTGAQRKNYAAVRYPEVLDLAPWVVGYDKKEDGSEGKALSDANVSMLAGGRREGECLYRLKAVVTHYGRHENGHYIAFRQHSPALNTAGSEPDDDTIANTRELEGDKTPWWRLSDEDVSPVSKADVLGQGGVFMLFYERILSLEKPEEMLCRVPAISDETAEPIAAGRSTSENESQVAAEAEDVSALAALQNDDLALATSTPLPTDELEAPVLRDYDHECSTGATTEDESEADVDDAPALGPVQPVPQLRMRTARIEERRDGGFGARQRFVEAS
ncbi:ubiquitin-specific protease ubp1 [Oleoguttula sp. CCFEE 5521]